MASARQRLLRKVDTAVDDLIPQVEEIKCVKGLKLRLTGIRASTHALQLDYEAHVRGHWQDPRETLRSRGVTGKIVMLTGTWEAYEARNNYRVTYPKAQLEVNLYFDFDLRA